MRKGCPLSVVSCRSDRADGGAARAFSLLEVMVAVALLALGLVLLLQVQARSIQLAQDARFITVATMLARGKLYDCQQDLLKKGFSIGDYDEEGKFDDEGFPTFYWECHAYQPELPVPDATEIASGASAASEATNATGAAPNPGEEMGMGFLAPVLSQMSGVLGDSIRELVVIVRWQDGGAWDDLRVVTHVVDKTAVNNVAGAIRQASGAMGGIPGLGGPGGASAPPIPGLGGRGGAGSPTGSPTNPGGALGVGTRGGATK